MKILKEQSVSIDSIPDANKNGNCYKIAVDTMMKLGDNTNAKLVHGVVTGRGAIKGVQYGHAWVEKNNKVIDNTIPLTMDKDAYYLLGHVGYTHKYSFREMLNELLRTEHYGPWDEEFDKYQ